MPELITHDVASARGLTRFFTGEPCSRGHVSERQTKNKTCVVCREEDRRARRSADPEKARAEWREAYHATKDRHVEKNRARAAQWRADNPDLYKEQQRKYAVRDSAARVEKAAKWAAENVEKMREHRKTWKKSNPEKVLAQDAKRRAAELQAMPAWLTRAHHAAIAAVYREAITLTASTGVPHHVDHIVPLQGKRVCGLHVPWNLQAIPGADNVRKSNKHD